MKILCEISIGELLDKIAILHIKSIFLKGREEQKNILYEMKLLNKTLKRLNLNKCKVSKLLSKLIKLNKKSWKLIERINEKMEKKEVDDDFLDISYKVLYYNILRFKLKNEANQKFGSKIKEMKSYKKYAI